MLKIHDAAKKTVGSIKKAIGSTGSLDEKQMNILIYIIERIYNHLIFLVLIGSILVIMSLFNIHTVKTTIVAYLSFIAIRRTFGGAHVKSDYLCLFLTVTSNVILGFIATIIKFNAITLFGGYLFAILTAVFIGVKDNPNKRLSYDKKRKYRMQGIITLGLICIVNTIVFALDQNNISNAIALGVIIGFLNLYFSR